MSENKEWTSLVGCVRDEKITNEQKFLLVTMGAPKNVYTKGLEVSEIAEVLILAILAVAKENSYGKMLIDTICDVLQKEKSEL